ncbi:hypothetical protein [Glycomyces sp. NRRL B-16210]|uniref:hypothetical protein n=1 Tax=Glycomyces sp. NRRL B-16210 TaxID=1463821 RepID=UPI0004C23C38|nr:hypothetical protein [Glycomyces sp. NRRL B-16210]
MRRARAGIIAVFLLAAFAAAVAGNRAAPRVEPSAPPNLSATAEIRRSFAAPGIVTVAVTNRGTAPVRVLGVELVSDSFAPLGMQETDVTVPPGETPRDLTVEHGAARCPDGVDSTAAPATAVLRVATEDGAEHEVAAALPHPNGTLDRLLREACAAEAVAAAARIELGPLVAAEDGTLTGALTLTPQSGADLAATEVRGSALFTVAAAEGLPAEGAIALAFDAHRCEGHAVGDAKQPFAFTVWLAIDGGEPLAAPIEVGPAQREALWAMLEVRCAHAD